MAQIYCPACGHAHRYTATGLATLVEAALAGDLHRVGVTACRKRGKLEMVPQIFPVCPLDLVHEQELRNAAVRKAARAAKKVTA